MSTHGLTDAEQVAALREQGVGERCIAREFGDLAARDVELAMTRPDYVRDHGAMIVNIRAHQTVPRGPMPSEASVQRKIVLALKAAGWRVWRIGQRDARKTQDPGVPDLYAMRPWARGVGPTAAWIECKRADGRQSPTQREFNRLCEHAGVRYIVARGLDDIRELL